MLSATLLVSCLCLGDFAGISPNARVSVGHAGRFGVDIGPLFSGQVLGGFGIIIDSDRKFAVALMPQLGASTTASNFAGTPDFGASTSNTTCSSSPSSGTGYACW